MLKFSNCIWHEYLFTTHCPGYPGKKCLIQHIIIDINQASFPSNYTPVKLICIKIPTVPRILVNVSILFIAYNL